MEKIKIINKNYPKIGEKFYWKDEDNNIHEAICMKIEGEDIDTLETMFFIYISKNGGGCFVTESDIVDYNSKEVIEFKKRQAKEKIKEISDYISQNEVKQILIEKLIKHAFTNNEANKILNILSSYN